MRLELVITTVVLSLSIAPTAAANHGYETVKPLIDAGVTIIVTEDGAMPPGKELPGGPVQLLTTAEYMAIYEHPELDALQLEARAPPLPTEPWNDVGTPPQGPTLNALGQGARCNHNTATTWFCYVPILVASDSYHAPPNLCNMAKSSAGVNRFETTYSGVTMYEYCAINSCWDASDEGTSVDAYVLLDDFFADVEYNPSCNTAYAYYDFDVPFAWTKTMNHNGIANPDSWYGLGIDYGCWGCAKWDLDEIIQHEISHNFNAYDDGFWGWEGDGIMNYYDAWAGQSHWGGNNWQIVGNNLKDCSCYGSGLS